MRYLSIHIRMPKSKTLTPLNAGRDVQQQNSHSLLRGMQSGTATLEDSLAVSHKTKHTFTIQSSNHTTWVFTQMS